MNSLNDFNNQQIRYVFCDIDDTLTTHGKLPANSYNAIWDLQSKGIKVIPVTGRPAGWCEMIARFWPVDGVVGENGGFYFRYIDGKMKRNYVFDETTRKINQEKLKTIEEEVLKKVPGCAIASDQFCRQMDLAVDFCEDVEPLPQDQIQNIVEVFKSHGAIAKVSSIHVNGWFGEYDKLTMVKTFCENELGFDIAANQNQCAFIGDSPNDEPMFGFFENSFAVANIKNFADQLESPPKFVCDHDGADGFVQFAKLL